MTFMVGRMRRLTPIHAPGLSAEVVRVSDLREAGVKRWRLNAADLGVPTYGMRAAPGVDGTAWATRVAGLQLVLSEGQFVSRCSAARLLLFPLPWRLSGGAPKAPIEVGAVRPRRPPERRGVTGHQVQPGVLRSTPSAPDWLPDPADVWGLLGASLGVDDLIIVGDHLISQVSRAPGPRCTPADMLDTVSRFAGAHKIDRLRQALQQVRAGVASPSETLTRLTIVRAGFPEPETQCPVATAERTYHADLGYPQWRIAIEYDGQYHFDGGDAQLDFDNERREAMKDAGWVVLSLTSVDLRDPTRFLRRLRRAIARAR